MGTVWE